MAKRATGSILICALIFVVAGCAPRRTPYDDLYASLKEQPGEWNPAVLEGRRIVIDPGHGGAFDGATGPDSLSEADVNLGVALHLWGLLEDAGAEVYLTRTTDRDFLAAHQEEVRDDLMARVELANAFDPEVFISIHHNSNIALDREKNSVEIYYKNSRNPGPSLELARDVHLHLARNLGIEETVIKPGSYFVLRNSDANASILGEASYLSHPAVEKRLKLSEKQRLEAEAYFLGLLSYFSRGVPLVTRSAPLGDTLTDPLILTFRAHPGAGVPLDPASARIMIRGIEMMAHYDDRSGLINYSLDSHLPNGPYAVEALIRSMGGATGRCYIELVINRPPRYVIPLHAAMEADSSSYFSIMILDRLGQPIAFGNRIIVRDVESGAPQVGSSNKGIVTFRAAQTDELQTFIVEAPGLTDTVSFALPDRAATLLAVDSESGKRIPFPIAVGGEPADSSATVSGDTRGNLWIPPAFEGKPFTVFAAGYQPALLQPDGIPEHGLLKLKPLFGGILAGVRIVIDPAGGGSDPGGRGADESRGASVNLDVATLLREILRRGGAHVSITRRGEEVLSPRERIYRTNKFRADLAISIHHTGGETDGICSILHYPASTGGISLAGELAGRLEGLPPCESYVTGESATLFLQQTNCPACKIIGGPIEDESSGAILVNPRYAQQAAQRIAGAILGYIGAERWKEVERTFIIDLDGHPVEGAMVSFDQAMTSSTDALGKARFHCLEPGLHVISYFIPGDRPISLTWTIDIGDEQTKEMRISFSSREPAGEP